MKIIRPQLLSFSDTFNIDNPHSLKEMRTDIVNKAMRHVGSIRQNGILLIQLEEVGEIDTSLCRYIMSKLIITVECTYRILRIDGGGWYEAKIINKNMDTFKVLIHNVISGYGETSILNDEEEGDVIIIYVKGINRRNRICHVYKLFRKDLQT